MQLSTRIGEELRLRVNAYAETRGITISDALRELIALGSGFGVGEAHVVNEEYRVYATARGGGRLRPMSSVVSGVISVRVPRQWIPKGVGKRGAKARWLTEVVRKGLGVDV